MSTLLSNFALFGFLGWTVENLTNLANPDFLACHVIPRQWSTTTCWIPILPVHAFGGLAWHAFWTHGGAQKPLWQRVLFYAVAFNAIEYVGGVIGEHMICPQVNTCPANTKLWHYDGLGSLHGHIDVPHTIAWVALGLLAEQLYPALSKFSTRELAFGAISIWFLIHFLKRTIHHHA